MRGDSPAIPIIKTSPTAAFAQKADDSARGLGILRLHDGGAEAEIGEVSGRSR